jgi:aminoglycoside phosphotransferase (APT) family kinase protein
MNCGGNLTAKPTKNVEINNALFAYFQVGHDPEKTVEITDVGKIESGRQHEMFSFTLVERVHGRVQTRPSILRLYDGNQAGENAEYEYTVMKRIGKSGVPVPDVYIFEPDAGYLGRPFIIMEKINGVTLGDLVKGRVKDDPSWVISDEGLKWVDNFASILALVHRINWKALGLTFLRRACPKTGDF